MRRSPKLHLEQLESRNLLSIFGVPWPDGRDLTLSFEPDGTNINGSASNLFSAFNASMPQSTWQRQILKAFQTWAVQSNLNIGIVADGGQPNGVAGGPSGDSRFGDIRIGGFAQPRATGLVETSPFSVLTGTWSGDSIINTADPFSAGGVAGTYDLFTAYLQEAGHVFGMDNSTDPTSVMFENYQGVRQGLNAADIAGIQALYGLRQPDQYEGTAGNDSLATATPLNVGNGVQISADISTLQDADYYQLTGLQAGSYMSVRLQTQGISLLKGQITLFKNGQAISTMSPSDINQNIKLIIPNVDATATYTIEVQSGSGDVFGIGSYQLVVKPTSSADPTGDAAIPFFAYHTNYSLMTATSLYSQQIVTSSGYSYSYKGAFSFPSELDFYKLQSSEAGLQRGSVMTVMAWTQGWNRVDPKVTVFDQYGNPVAAQVLVNQQGEYVVQVANATSPTYYVEVQAANPYGSHATGSYFLGVQFGNQTIGTNALPSASLTSTGSITEAKMQIADTRLFHFSLSVAGMTSTDAARITIFDQNQNSVATAYTSVGGTVTFNVLLGPGTYYLGFAGGQTTGAALSSSGITFTFSYLVLSDPIDPDISDPLGGTSGSSTSSPIISPFDTTSSSVVPLPPPPPPA
jgi:hypothetical protein